MFRDCVASADVRTTAVRELVPSFHSGLTSPRMRFESPRRRRWTSGRLYACLPTRRSLACRGIVRGVAVVCATSSKTWRNSMSYAARERMTLRPAVHVRWCPMSPPLLRCGHRPTGRPFVRKEWGGGRSAVAAVDQPKLLCC